MDYIKYKHIKGYDDKYIAFSTGKIFSTRTNRFLYIQTSDDPRQKYAQVKLYKNGKPKTTTIHRIIAEHFIENPFNLPSVDHINRNKYDNDVSNLRWASYKKQSNNTNTTSRNNTGIRGVQLYRNSVISSFVAKNGKYIRKYFTLSKYSYEEALRLAEEYRNKHKQVILY